MVIINRRRLLMTAGFPGWCEYYSQSQLINHAIKIIMLLETKKLQVNLIPYHFLMKLIAEELMK